MKPIFPVLLAAAAAGGWLAARHFGPASTELRPGARVSFYQSPMHPWVKSDQPGQCTVCGMDLVPVYEGGAGFDHAVSHDLVILPPGSPNVIGVRTAEVKSQPLARTLRVAGMIGEDESRHGVVSAPVEGRIDGLAMNHEGQSVTRRQPLATIFSRTLLNAANDYQLALKQSVEAAEPAKRRLEQYGLVWEQIKTIPGRQPDDLYFGILAQQTGVIVKSYVSEGQYVKEGDRLFEIADFTRMWFMFPAYQQDLPLLQAGQIATLTVPGLTRAPIQARISGISPTLDGMTRSAMVRVTLENPERRLKNKSYAEATIAIEAPEVTAVPRSAVLWPGKGPRVYVEKAPGSYQQRTVRLGRSGDDHWEVLEGLTPGERVVVSGNMLIDSQAQIEAMAVTAQPVGPTGKDQMDPAAIPAVTAFLNAAAALSTALAIDDLAAANLAVAALPPAPGGSIKTAAPAAAADLVALRKAFLPWSEEVAAWAVQWGGHLPGLHIFRCPMTKDLWPGAPANARWVQMTDGLRNPYWGKEMLECGIEVKP